MEPSIAIAYHSGYGHTAAVARAVARGAARGGGRVSLLRVEEPAGEPAGSVTAASAAPCGGSAWA